MFVRIKKMPMKILAQNKKKLSVSIKIIKDTFQGFIDDNVMRLSASLAYATPVLNHPSALTPCYYRSITQYRFHQSVICPTGTHCRLQSD